LENKETGKSGVQGSIPYSRSLEKKERRKEGLIPVF
jgi:hypothetical protein